LGEYNKNNNNIAILTSNKNSKKIMKILQIIKDFFTNYSDGFIEVAPTETDYFHTPDGTLGGEVLKKVLIKNGDFSPYRPDGELQRRSNGTETMACVTFSAMNCIETIINYFIYLVNSNQAENYQIEIVRIFREFNLIKNDKANFSDRYIAKLSGTTSNGNNQQRVANAIRHYGLVSEDDWGWVSGWNEYYKDIPNEIIAKGQRLLKYIEFNYEWVIPSHFSGSRQYGPIQTSVYAGFGWGSSLIYRFTTTSRNHAVTSDYEKTSSYSGIFDSYDPFDKKVSWDSPIGSGMLYTIHLKDISFNISEIKKLLAKGLKFIMRADSKNGGKGQIYELNDSGLKELTDQEKKDEAIKVLFENKQLVGVTEDTFNKLLC